MIICIITICLSGFEPRIFPYPKRPAPPEGGNYVLSCCLNTYHMVHYVYVRPHISNYRCMQQLLLQRQDDQCHHSPHAAIPSEGVGCSHGMASQRNATGPVVARLWPRRGGRAHSRGSRGRGRGGGRRFPSMVSLLHGHGATGVRLAGPSTQPNTFPCTPEPF